MTFTRNFVTVALSCGLLSISATSLAAEINADTEILSGYMRDLTASGFDSLVTSSHAKRRIPIDIDVYSVGAAPRYALTWRENSDNRSWIVKRGQTTAQLESLNSRYSRYNYRMLDMESTMTPAGKRYTALWIRNSENNTWSTRRGLSQASFDRTNVDQKRAGKKIVDVEMNWTAAGMRYDAIWRSTGHPRRVHVNLERSAYQTLVNQYAQQGYRVSDYESVKTPAGQRYAAIWVNDGTGRAWAVKTNLTPAEFNNQRRTWRDKGLRLVDFESYGSSSGQKHAGIWLENNVTRYRWSKKNRVDQLVTSYQQVENVPGVSVAINQNGRTMYRRGIGMADIARGKVAHGSTVYLAASISKAIGATLAVLIENEVKLADGTRVNFDLSQPTSNYLTQGITGPSPLSIPVIRTHTLEELLSHLGCVHHYGSGPSPASVHYPWNFLPVRQIWYAAPVSGCTVGSTPNNYSTHAFTYVGAALEVATNRPISRLVREEIGERFNLPMRAMYESKFLPYNYERTVPYSNNQATTYEQNSWKVLGGGIETSAAILANFGWKLLDSQIMNASTRDNRLWNPITSNSVYALGWKLGSDAHGDFVEHGGRARGARSHLRIYRDNNLVIAVMSNQNSGFSVTLVNNIANEVLN